MKTIIATIILFFALSTGLQAQVDRTTQPPSGPAPKINLGKPEMFTLKNGLKVMVVENHKLPRVTGTLIIDNGPIYEGEKAGVSSILSGMLGNGTTTIAKDKFNEEIDFLGASLNVSSQRVSFNTLSRYFPRILELTADASQNPLLTQEEFEKQKAQLIEGIKSGQNDVGTIANQVRGALSYGKEHPYGEFSTEVSAARISLDDARKFYTTYFKPNNAYLIIVGDVNFKETKNLISEHFKDWKQGELPAYSIPKVNNVQKPEINFVDMPNAVQSNIAVMHMIDLKMGNPDFFPVLLANKIYGGGAEGRLFLNLREDKGYTYGAYSSVGTDERTSATFRSFATVRNAVTDSAVVEFMKEIELMRNSKVTEEELEVAKASYVGDFVMALEEPATVAGYAFNIESKSLPANFYETYLEKINAVTSEDIQRVSQKYFRADQVRILVVGKGTEVLPNLSKLPYPIHYFDKEGNPTEKPELTKPLPAGVTKESVLTNYLSAIGGAEKISDLKSTMVVYEAEAMGNKIQSAEKRTPTNYMSEMSMGGNVMMKVLMSKEGVTMNGQPLPPNLADDMKSNLGTFGEIGLLGNQSAVLTGLESVDGKDCYVITDKGDSVTSIYFYDVESGLKVKETQIVTMGANSQTQDAYFSDYKDFDGIKFPSKKTGNMGPQKIEFNLIDAKVNQGVSMEDFK
ncbi:MAG: pitrilysin family protein [Lutimonas sp.]